MTTKLNFYSAFLLTVSISLIGCQTTPTAPSKVMPQYENIRTMQAEIDSDGDGVPDELDQCPATPFNVVVDDRGCPFTMPGVGLKMEYRAFFDKGSSELLPKYQAELDNVAEKMREYDTATMLIIGTSSVDEINETASAKVQPNSLSKNRALIVKNYLLLNHQINPDRLSTFDCGAKAPIASSDTEERKAMNRRVYGMAEEVKDEVSRNRSIDSYAKICLKVK